MKREVYISENAGCTGPYSHAVDSGDYVYLSGQTPINPAVGEITAEGITEQTKQSFKNLFSILHEMGMNEGNVQKVNVYLTDMNNFDAMNAVYEQQFTAPYPARTTVGVTGLCGGALIEIDLIAKK